MPHFFTFTQSVPSGNGSRNRIRHNLQVLDDALAHDETRDLAAAALAVAAHVVEERRARLPETSPPLDDREAAALRRMGVEPPGRPSEMPEPSRPEIEGAARQTEIMARAIPLQDLAVRLGVSDARLRQRIKERTLVAIPKPHGRGWLIPEFQVTDRGLLPHLTRILRSLRREVSVVALDGFFRTPQDELSGATPRDWLAAGGDPAPVEQVAAGL